MKKITPIVKLEYGKHAYAPNVKAESIKNIKILPPLLLRPIPTIAKEIVTVYRTKRDVINSTNARIPENINQNAEIENGTVPSVKIDQVTQAITVNQISGTPPPTNEKEVTPPLNFQPFSITSSDFKNNSAIADVDSVEIDEDIQVAKLISEKLKEVTAHFDTDDEYTAKQENNSEEKEDITEDEVENKQNVENKEEDSAEENNEKYQNNEEQEDSEENNEKYQNEEQNEQEDNKAKYENNEEQENSSENIKENFQINVGQENSGEVTKGKFQINEEQVDSKEDTNEKYQNNEEQETSAENTNEKYVVNEEEEAENKPTEKGLIINVPEQVTNNENIQKQEASYEDEQSKKENIDQFPAIDEFLKHIIPSNSEENLQESSKTSNTKQKSNLDFSLEIQDKENEEVKDKKEKSPFYDFLSEQKEASNKLRGTLEYPDYDNEYEKYRADALDSYLGAKDYHFKTASQPYNIKLEGYYPYEKLLQENNDEDDEENDKEKIVQHEYRDEEDEEPQTEQIQNENEESAESKITETKTKVVPNKNIIDELHSILEKRNAISRQKVIKNPENFNTFWTLKYKVPKH